MGHLWTLALEEQFYLCWPLLFVLVPVGRLKTVTAVLILCVPFVRVATYLMVPEWRGYVGMMFHTAVDSILIGCWFALLTNKPNQFVEFLRSGVRYRLPIVLVMLVPMIVSPILRSLFGGAYSITVGITLDGFCVGLLMIYLEEKTIASRLRTILESSVLVWVGRLSYSLYLWQQPFLTPLNQTVFGVFPLSLVAAFASGCVSYYMVESPILKLKKKFTRVRLVT